MATTATHLSFLAGFISLSRGPVVGEGVAVVDLELAVLQSVQQHVHAREVVGGDALFLTVEHANAAQPDLLAHVQQQ